MNVIRMGERATMDIHESVGAVAQPSGKTGKLWRVALIRAGVSKNDRYYPEDVLEAATSLFEGAKVYAFEFRKGNREIVDHLPDRIERAIPAEYFPKSLVGFLKDVRFEEFRGLDGKRERGLTADFHVVDEDLAKRLLHAYEAGRPDLLGFSINANGSAEPEIRHGRAVARVVSISEVKSVDVVTEPAAGGEILRLVASMGGDAASSEEPIRMRTLIYRLATSLDKKLTEGVSEFTDKQAFEAVERLTSHPVYGKDFASIRESILSEKLDDAKNATIDLYRLVQGRAKIAAKESETEAEFASLLTKMMEAAKSVEPAKFQEMYGVSKEAAARMKRDLEELDEAAFAQKYGFGKKDAKAKMLESNITEAVAEQWEILGLPHLRGRVPKDPGGLSKMEGPDGSKGNDPDPKGRFSQPTQPAGQAQVGKDDVDLSRYRAVESRIDEKLKTLELRESAAIVEKCLAGASIPEAAKSRIREHFSGNIATEAKVMERIDAERKYVTSLTESWKGAGVGSFRRDTDVRLAEGTSHMDMAARRMDGLMFNQNACECGRWDVVGGELRPCRQHKQVPKYTSLHEAFADITGRPPKADRVLRESKQYVGLSEREDVGLKESLNSASWAFILGDSITRRLVAEYNLHGLGDWRKIVSDTTPIKDFRTNRRMRMGGYGLLPAVAEGANYVALASPTNEEATYAISKRGGLEDLTLEMIASDDVGSIRRIPLKLGRAAAQTIYREVFNRILQNQLVYDGLALGAGAHNNLAAAALSDAALTQAKRAMMNQTAFGNATEFLGEANLPKYLLVPSALEATALQLTTAAAQVSATAGDRFSTNPNLHSKYGLEYIVLPYWASIDAAENDWALVANPANVPTIEVGFFNGQEDPELFVQDQPVIGNVFSQDRVTYKIRHIYGSVVLDFRSFYLSVVA